MAIVNSGKFVPINIGYDPLTIGDVRDRLNTTGGFVRLEHVGENGSHDFQWENDENETHYFPFDTNVPIDFSTDKKSNMVEPLDPFELLENTSYSLINGLTGETFGFCEVRLVDTLHIGNEEVELEDYNSYVFDFKHFQRRYLIVNEGMFDFLSAGLNACDDPEKIDSLTDSGLREFIKNTSISGDFDV